MKKFSFKKIAMMGVVAVMALSMSSISAFALNYEETDTSGGIAPLLVNSIVPTRYLDISVSYIDQCNGATGTAYSEFYFSSGRTGKVSLVNLDMIGSKANDEITIQFVDYNTGNVLDSILGTVQPGGNITLNKNSVSLSSNTYFYTRWFINPGNKLTGRYSIVQN